MAVEGSGSSVIKDSLIRDIDVKDRAEYEGSFSGSDSKRDVKGENKAEDVRGIVDFSKVYFRTIRLAMVKFVWFVMVLPVLIAELKLRAVFFLKGTFSGIKLIESMDAVRTIIVTAFIDGDFFAFFPFKQGAIAIRAEIFGFGVFMEPLV